jgi:hypothetical protein
MKKLLYVLPAALLFLFAGAPRAQADTYVASVSCAFSVCPYGYVPQVGDVSFPAPTTMDITITSGTEPPALFEVDLPGRDLATDPYTWDYFVEGTVTTGWMGVLDINDSYTGLTEIATNSDVPFVDGSTFGYVTFSPASAAAPELPGSILIVLGGGLILLVTRKRLRVVRLV